MKSKETFCPSKNLFVIPKYMTYKNHDGSNIITAYQYQILKRKPINVYMFWSSNVVIFCAVVIFSTLFSQDNFSAHIVTNCGQIDML